MNDIELVLARVARRRPKLIDLSLDRVFSALERLGNPHRKLPPVFHVAGTNGKGSTVAYIRSILEAADKTVHVYTSPHLVRFNERIVLSGKEISDAALIAALVQCDEVVGEQKLTYFETVTCAALIAFTKTPADYLVMEVGLGGRLDATNVLDEVLAAVITPVDLDHQQFLGHALGGIAAEKAGIFRRGAPAIFGRQAPEVMSVLQQCARDTGAKVFAYGEQWDVYPERGRMTYQDDDGLSDLDLPRLAGIHQIENAGLAIAAVKAAGLKFSDEILSTGISSTFAPARMQRLTKGPLIDLARELLGEEPEIWLDGGHNPHAARAIAQLLADMEERSPKPLAMISGMQANKDATGYFAPFAGLASEVFTVAADYDGVASADAVAAAAKEAGLNANVCKSVVDAVTAACRDKINEPPRLLICGSLYLAGEVLKDHR
ncbi:MAG: bifunctional folylpolyglutamate synthase/dihydrofolate synthase [Marinicaulis sp.]|nr:bifunctional folylpolyglutamate synthase/dihydrofolate synthase [Marinicaulis sp.]